MRKDCHRTFIVHYFSNSLYWIKLYNNSSFNLGHRILLGGSDIVLSDRMIRRDVRNNNSLGDSRLRERPLRSMKVNAKVVHVSVFWPLDPTFRVATFANKFDRVPETSPVVWTLSNACKPMLLRYTGKRGSWESSYDVFDVKCGK